MKRLIPFIFFVAAVVFFFRGFLIADISNPWRNEMASAFNVVGASSLILAGGVWFLGNNTPKK